MATDNATPFHDYSSTTGTFGVHFTSALWKGFQWEFSQFLIYDIYSKNITEIDSATGQGSRYEIANYDFENLNSRNLFFRLENLNISYSYKNQKITLGRQYLKTPMINLQDGRMRPTMVEGLWLDSSLGNKVKFNAGFIYRMLPRSIHRWYGVGESLGLHGTGIDVYGNPSSYKNNIQSLGIFISHIGYLPKKTLQLDVWNYVVENVFQTSLLQAEWKYPVSKRKNYYGILGGQLWYQTALSNGGSENRDEAYIPPGSHSVVCSFKAGIENIKLKVTGNFTMLPGKNRFLLPREWGVETFYTFIPRERLEGSATSRSIALKTEYNLFPNWNLSLLSAWVHMPDVFDFESNKYQVPSYFHLNFASRYKFKGWMDGLSLFVMYVYKGRLGETYDSGKFIINKINLSNYNAVIDYSF